METTKKKKVTLDSLAAMIKRQFDFMEEKMATKEDVREIIKEQTDRRIKIIEKIVLGDHRPRIRALEKELDLY